MGISLAAISGNHDGADRIAIGAEMLRQSGIYLATHLEDLTRPLRLEKDGERVDLHLLPYCDPATIRQFLGRDDLQGFQASYQALLDTVRPTLNPSAFQILVAHCFVAGSQTCDSESAIYVGGSGEVNLSAFAGFDYVALGHLHGPQRAGEHGRYSGSPLKYSFDEESHKKSIDAVNDCREWQPFFGTASHRSSAGCARPSANFGGVTGAGREVATK